MASRKNIKIVQNAARVSFDAAAWTKEKGEYGESHWLYLNPAYEILTYKHIHPANVVAAAQALVEEYHGKHADTRGEYVDESEAILGAADAFTRSYIASACWTGVELPYGDARSDSSRYDDATPDDIAPDTLREMVADCEQFQRENAAVLALAYDSGVYIQGERYGPENAGHDFWLTRNGHGAGFWDRGLDDQADADDEPTTIGDDLTEASSEFGEYSLVMDDSGRITSA